MQYLSLRTCRNKPLIELLGGADALFNILYVYLHK